MVCSSFVWHLRPGMTLVAKLMVMMWMTFMRCYPCLFDEGVMGQFSFSVLFLFKMFHCYIGCRILFYTHTDSLRARAHRPELLHNLKQHCQEKFSNNNNKKPSLAIKN